MLEYRYSNILSILAVVWVNAVPDVVRDHARVQSAMPVIRREHKGVTCNFGVRLASMATHVGSRLFRCAICCPTGSFSNLCKCTSIYSKSTFATCQSKADRAAGVRN